MTVVGTQIDSDRRLLEFQSYEEYLDSLVIPVDLCYLRSTTVARRVAEMGYRCTGETLDKDAFHRRVEAVKGLLFPVRRPYELASEFIAPANSLLRELALRERANRLGVLGTVVFLRHYTKFNFEVSGYIDFLQRLEREDWTPYFRGKKRLWPLPTDLGYYHWRMGKSLLNDSPNFQAIVDPKRGLLFKNLGDGKLICVDPNAPSPGVDTTRVRVYCDRYEHVVLYDHVVRGKF